MRSSAREDACAALARTRVRACMRAMTRATILSATDDDDGGATASATATTRDGDDDDDRVSDADDRASTATEEARDDEDDEDANRLGRAREVDEGASSVVDANDDARARALADALSAERAMRQGLEAAMESREVAHATERETLEARARDAEAGRVAAEAEASHLRGEIARGETVIRQEESVIRLRLEAEHEVRVGRLATELDRVRGELEARSSELHDARANDAKAFDALNRVREELLGRLKSETQKLLGTIDYVCDAMNSASKSLHRDGVAATPRISQSVPSRRERTLVVDTKQSRGHGAVGTPEPSTPTSSQSRHRASSHATNASSSTRREVASSSQAQQNAQRRLHLSAQSDRLRKPIASQKGLVGYANIYQH